VALRSNEAVFLDRDGVIIVEKNFIIDPSDIEFIPGSLEALKRVPENFLKIIISNQSGIGRGFFTVEQVEKFNGALIEKIKKNGALIDRIYYCPHDPDDNCDCRKPGIRLFEMARTEYNIKFEDSWMIGDKKSDILAGKNIGAKTILVLTGYAGNESNDIEVESDFTAKDLLQAVEIIRKWSPRKKQQP
jgi:D-glycero-D-manno-heptose 1,7-bisphosphate phosphatase